MGVMSHLENPATLYMHDGYVTIETISANDEAAALKVHDLAKIQGAAVMAANPESCVRITLSILMLREVGFVTLKVSHPARLLSVSV